MESGYSGTPLVKKLGIKPRMKARFINPPTEYFNWLEGLPEIQVLTSRSSKKQFIHVFVSKAKALQKELPLLKGELEENGMIWVSWPKKSSKVETDVTEDVIRNLALSIGLVDVKVCAVNATWSGLKLVIPVKDRKIRKG